MISDWREKWQIEFPFYFAQIAPWNYGTEIFSQILRESQLKSLKTPKTGMAVTMDVANSENVHPAKKREVGERLSLWALKNEYGKDIIPSGPIYDSFIIDKEKIILSFLYDEGMFLKPIDGKSNFQIAGEDRIFVDAQVEIINYKLIISSNEVKYPKSVRYCWDNTSYGTLFNNAKLPASSFRTDNWKN
jgi:sialate O-acetylesterase